MPMRSLRKLELSASDPIAIKNCNPAIFLFVEQKLCARDIEAF